MNTKFLLVISSIILFLIFTDTLIPKYCKYPLLCALLDNITHGLNGGILWRSASLILDNIEKTRKNITLPLTDVDISHKMNSIFGNINYQIIYETILSILISSSLDIDHFVSGGSMSFYQATHLRHRPFGHCLLLVLILSVDYLFNIIITA